MARNWYHDPVLLQEVLDAIPSDARFIMDGTLGHGGHSIEIMNNAKSSEREKWKSNNKNISVGTHIMRPIHIVGVDRDRTMMQKAQERLQEFASQMCYVQGSYAEFQRITTESWVAHFDVILLDIGVNMEHFKDGERGFSIKKDGPLDMRFDIASWIPASLWLKQCNKEQFKTMLTSYTDFSEKRIVHATDSFFLTSRDFATTKELYERAKSINMNDKAMAVFFQAIRIVVNGELDEFASFLKTFIEYLAPWGRCIILTYHSIEDRMAKNAFKALEDAGKATILTKHVIQPTWKEKERNPAARSAKMRVLMKK